VPAGSQSVQRSHSGTIACHPLRSSLSKAQIAIRSGSAAKPALLHYISVFRAFGFGLVVSLGIPDQPDIRVIVIAFQYGELDAMARMISRYTCPASPYAYVLVDLRFRTLWSLPGDVGFPAWGSKQWLRRMARRPIATRMRWMGAPDTLTPLAIAAF